MMHDLMRSRAVKVLLSVCFLITALPFFTLETSAAVTTGSWTIYYGSSASNYSTISTVTDLATAFNYILSYNWVRIHNTKSGSPDYDLGGTNRNYVVPSGKTVLLTGLACTYSSGHGNDNLFVLNGSTLYVGTNITLYKYNGSAAVRGNTGTNYLYNYGKITASSPAVHVDAQATRTYVYSLSGSSLSGSWGGSASYRTQYTMYRLTPSLGTNMSSLTYSGHFAIPLTAEGLVTTTSGSNITVSGTAATGYTATAQTITMNTNKSVTISAAANKYTVNLDANGGTDGATTEVTATYNAAMPTIASANRPTRTGYSFLGFWDTTSTTSTTRKQYYTASGASANTWDKTATTTLYAHWSANAYVATLDANGGTLGATTKVTATYNSAMPAITAANLPTRAGYTFAGFFDTNAATGGTQYYSATGSSSRAWNKAASATLYARWTPNTYSASLDANGGEAGGTTSVSVTFASALPTIASASLPTPPPGYAFAGFYDAPVASNGTMYYTAGGISARTWDKAGSSTLYAAWQGLPYIVHLDRGEGATGGVTSVTATYGAAMPSIISSNLPTRIGHVFEGYFDEEGTQYYNASGRSVRAWDIQSDDVVLYAKWSLASYTVKLNALHGEGTPLTSYTYGTGATLPTDWVRDGYNFGGWYDNRYLFGKAIETIAPDDTGNKEYFPKWTSTHIVTEIIDSTDEASMFTLEKESNLDAVFDYVVDEEELRGADTVTLSLEVGDILEDNNETEAIRSAADGIEEVYFFDVTLTKTVSVDEEKISSTVSETAIPVMISIALDGELANRSFYRVYRYHDGVVELLSTDSSADEYYAVDAANNQIVIYSMKFSTYAIFANNVGLLFGEKYPFDVQAKVSRESSVTYKMDIAWGSMKFDYAVHELWDPDTHSYNGEAGDWAEGGFEDGNNKITAYNHSNVDLLLSFTVKENLIPGANLSLHVTNSTAGDPAREIILKKVEYEGADTSSVNAFLQIEGRPNDLDVLRKEAYTKAAVITVTADVLLEGGYTPKTSTG